jgi:hypothetical protein
VQQPNRNAFETTRHRVIRFGPLTTFNRCRCFKGNKAGAPGEYGMRGAELKLTKKRAFKKCFPRHNDRAEWLVASL